MQNVLHLLPLLAAPLPGNRLGGELAASRDATVLPQLFFADFSALAFLVAVQVNAQEIPSRMDLDLRSGFGRVETRPRQSLKKGVQPIRISTISGAWNPSRLRWEQAP